MSKADERIKNFKADEQRKRIQLGVGASLAGITCVLLIIIFGGDFTEPARELLGLSDFLAGRDGVYADCSRPENRYNKFCQDYYSNAVRQPLKSLSPWERPGDRPPFTLYDK